MEVGIFKLSISAIQNISAKIIGNKKHYLNTPDEILNWRAAHYIYALGHLFPTIIITILYFNEVRSHLTKR